MLIEELARNASVGKQTDLVLLDFSKAFDKLNHSKLLRKLMHLVGSVPSCLLGLSQSFWMVRNQTRFQSQQESVRALCWARFCSSSSSGKKARSRLETV